MKNTKFNTDIFIEKSKIKHGEKYDYSLVEYNRCDLKVKIICPIHGVFEQQAYLHYNIGCGCIKCAEDYTASLSRKGIEKFILEANLIHNGKFDYSLSNYNGALKKIKIICPTHGIFEQTPDNHLHKKGCKKCHFENLKILNTLTNDEFIKKANLVHDNYFDYSLCKYEHNNKKIKIMCPIHNEFEQIPSNHLSGKGCRKCSSSKGEIKIRKILNILDIKLKEQHVFSDCKNVISLPFDFYLHDYNMCIEFDGIQHYQSIAFFGGEEKFKERIKNDKIKNEYCFKNNIHLIRIKYNDIINEFILSNLINCK